MPAATLHPHHNPPANGAAVLWRTELPYPTPGAYTTTASTYLQIAQQLGALLLDFNSTLLYQPVFPPLHPLSLKGIFEFIQTLFTNLENPPSQFTPPPLQFKQPNSINSATATPKKTQEAIESFAQALQLFTAERAWPVKHEFPPIVFLPKTQFNRICKETNTSVQHHIAQLETGEILVR